MFTVQSQLTQPLLLYRPLLPNPNHLLLEFLQLDMPARSTDDDNHRCHGRKRRSCDRPRWKDHKGDRTGMYMLLTWYDQVSCLYGTRHFGLVDYLSIYERLTLRSNLRNMPLPNCFYYAYVSMRSISITLCSISITLCWH